MDADLSPQHDDAAIDPIGTRNGPARSASGKRFGAAQTDGAGCDPVVRQQVSEPKAFTGRGAPAAEERRLRFAINRVHTAIERLSAQTRTVRGRRFYLMVQKRKHTGAIFLRWRDTGAGGGHVPWHKVAEFTAREPASLHTWYERINEHAMELNDEEQIRRLALALFLRRRARLGGDGSLDYAAVGGARREPLADR